MCAGVKNSHNKTYKPEPCLSVSYIGGHQFFLSLRHSQYLIRGSRAMGPREAWCSRELFAQYERTWRWGFCLWGL